MYNNNITVIIPLFTVLLFLGRLVAAYPTLTAYDSSFAVSAYDRGAEYHSASFETFNTLFGYPTRSKSGASTRIAHPAIKERGTQDSASRGRPALSEESRPTVEK